MKLITIQASAIKSVFEVLKDILNDVTIHFTTEGINMTTLDTTRTSLIDISMSAENFEEYECPKNIDAGLNASNLYKLLKIITNNDVLKLIIDCEEVMKMEIFNETNKTLTKFSIKLLDMNETKIEIPEMNMTTITPIKSIDLQRICRDMYNISDTIQITRNSNDFILKCNGDFADQETVIYCVDESIYISGMYSLKYMNIFTKATNLSSMTQIMQEEQNRFLILKYNIANLGELKFYLATKVTEDL